MPSASLPSSLKPTTSGISIETGWPSIDGLSLDPANAPTQNAQTIDHGGVTVGADQRVGICDGFAVLSSLDQTTLARYSRFTWWQMPVPGRHNAEV